MARLSRVRQLLLLDVLVIAFGVGVAVWAAQSGILLSFLGPFQHSATLGSFVAGIFFTSVFTTGPAIVVLGEIARLHGEFVTAVSGAFGAVVGDIIIFRFARNTFSEHVSELLMTKGMHKRFTLLFSKRSYRWVAFLLGGLVIASPLPDEIGVTLLGFAKMKEETFIPLSLTFNFLGILIIGLVAQSF